jgi:hypothetical protein
VSEARWPTRGGDRCTLRIGGVGLSCAYKRFDFSLFRLSMFICSMLMQNMYESTLARRIDTSEARGAWHFSSAVAILECSAPFGTYPGC